MKIDSIQEMLKLQEEVGITIFKEDEKKRPFVLNLIDSDYSLLEIVPGLLVWLRDSLICDVFTFEDMLLNVNEKVRYDLMFYLDTLGDSSGISSNIYSGNNNPFVTITGRNPILISSTGTGTFVVNSATTLATTLPTYTISTSSSSSLSSYNTTGTSTITSTSNGISTINYSWRKLI
jgi:hypothetical protein